MWAVIHGDCVEEISKLEDGCFDSIVTDPPYALDFMGKDWDSFGDGKGFQAWCEEWARECLRVLKPGGHMLAFGGTRTYHRLACAIEDAGFEIRDSIHWIYGSGFPKSLDVSKAIDKRRDDTTDMRVVCRWLRAAIDAHPAETMQSIAERFGFHSRMIEHWAARDTDSQPAVPTLEQWDRLRDLLGFCDEMDAEVYRLNLRKGEPGEAWIGRPVTGAVEEWANRTNYALTSRDGLRRDLPVTDDAKQWEGWGTALKPAHEPIVMARKPLAAKHTVAGNVLKYGTGGINIDGCRIDNYGETGGTEGRWPANLVFSHSPGCASDCADDCPVAELDRQSGNSRSAASMRGERAGNIYGNGKGPSGPNTLRGHSDTGGASRFFYCAKAGKKERPVVEGITGHPTVKPRALIRYLVRLVTPLGGTVLDLFGGSGTTAEACEMEGFNSVLVERDPDSIRRIEARMADRTFPHMLEIASTILQDECDPAFENYLREL